MYAATMEVEEVAAIADRLMGSSRRWEPLDGGGGANIVLRGGGLVAKWSLREETHQREVEAARLISDRLPGLVPSVVAAGEGVMVMDDIGTGVTLADHFIDGDAVSAAAAVLEWAEVLSNLHETMWLRPGDEVLHSSHVILFGFMHQAVESEPRLTTSGRWAAAATEWEVLTSLALSGGPTTLSIGDMCPGNQMWTDDGLRFFDLEAAGHFNPALDAAYLITPWSSCWCAWDLPAQLREQAVERYLSEMSRSEEVRSFLVDAVVLWAVGTAGFMFDNVDSDVDRPMRDGVNTPHRRSVVMTRLDRAVGYPGAASRFPRTVEWLHEVLGSLTDAWGDVDPLPVAPAFR